MNFLTPYRTLAILTLFAANAFTQPALSPPRLGFVEDSARTLRPVYGIANNFVLGDAVAAKVVAEAFSGSLGLLKTDSSLTAFDSDAKPIGSIDVARGAALFAFSPDGAAALVYNQAANALIEWRGGAFTPVAANLPEARGNAVLALGFPNPSEALFIVERRAPHGSSGVWEVRVPLGAAGVPSQKALVGVRAPLLALPAGGLLYSSSDGVVVRREDSSEVHIVAHLPSRFLLRQMTADWVELLDLESSNRFAIHTAPGREALYQLPANGTE